MVATVIIDDSKLSERTKRNNRNHWISTRQFVQTALEKHRIAARVTLRPVNSSRTAKNAIVRSRPLRITYRPAGGESTWDYDVDAPSIEYAPIREAIEAEMQGKLSATCANGLDIMKPVDNCTNSTNTASLVNSANDLLTLVNGLKGAADTWEKNRRKLEDDRKKLLLLKDDQKAADDDYNRALAEKNRCDKEVRALQDAIAAVELEMESNPEAMRAREAIQVLAALVKSA